jgi:hypothetical protein
MEKNTEEFKEFLLTEYSNIASAHFETGKQVSTFYKYYLIILAAPVVIVTLNQNKNLGKIITPSVEDIPIHWVAFIIMLLISVFGFLISWVVIDLHHDSILYARTVNGIRKYFYSKSELNIDEEKQIRVLPTEIGIPDFYSYGHLGIIVASFAIVNSSFFIAAMVIVSKNDLPICLLAIMFLAFFLLHFLVHYKLSKKRIVRHEGK